MSRKTKTALALLSALLLTQAKADDFVSPTFDCDIAGERAERIICSFEDLSVLDQELGKKLKSKTEHPLATTEKQADWVTEIRNRCTTPDCLRKAYRQRIDELDRSIKASPQPQEVLIQPTTASSGPSPGRPVEVGQETQSGVANNIPLSGKSETSNLSSAAIKDDSAPSPSEAGQDQEQTTVLGAIISFFMKLFLNSFIVFVYVVFGLYFVMKFISTLKGDSSEETGGGTVGSSRSSRKVSSGVTESKAQASRIDLYRGDKRVCATCKFWSGSREPNSHGTQIKAEFKKALCKFSILTRDPKTGATRGASRRETLPNYDGLNCKHYERWL